MPDLKLLPQSTPTRREGSQTKNCKAPSKWVDSNIRAATCYRKVTHETPYRWLTIPITFTLLSGALATGFVSSVPSDWPSKIAPPGLPAGPVGLRGQVSPRGSYPPNVPSEDSKSLGPSGTPLSITNVPVGLTPESMAFDPRNGYIYVPNNNSDNISVINGTAVVDTITLGIGPSSIVYDGFNGYIYVMEGPPYQLGVINGTRVLGNVSIYSFVALIGNGWPVMTVDPTDGFVYVPGSQVEIVNGTHVAAHTSSDGCLAGAYDSDNGLIYMLCAIDGNSSSANHGVVHIFSGTTLVSTIVAGWESNGIQYDGNNGYVYVANIQSKSFPSGTHGSFNLTVIQNTSIVAWVNLGTTGAGSYYPNPIAVDSRTGLVYVLNFVTGNISVVNGTHFVTWIQTGPYPTSIGYDPGDDYLYLLGPVTPGSFVSVIYKNAFIANVSLGSSSAGILYDNRTGNLYVVDLSTNEISMIAVPYNVTFQESGLPAGDTWWVNVSTAPPASSTTSNLSISLYGGSYYFSVSTSDKEYAAVSGALPITGNTLVKVQFHLVTYPVTFTESGLPSGLNWSVSLSGSSENSTSVHEVFDRPNGTYPYLVTGPPGYRPANGASASGSAVVDGGAVNLPIQFTGKSTVYAITFVESGLPADSDWTVVVDSIPMTSNVTSLSFAVLNGSYWYSVGFSSGYLPDPASGLVVITGIDRSVSVVFTPIPAGSYLVNFTESGLPPLTNWSVNLSGDAVATEGPTLSFLLSNGTFPFHLGKVPGWTTASFSGELTVDGQPLVEGVNWSRVAYPVTFSESVLPTGSGWWVEVGGYPLVGSTAPTLTMELPNGSYTFTAAPLDPDYRSETGAFGVAGVATSVAVDLPLVTFQVTLQESGLAPGTPWSATLGGTNASTSFNELTFEEPNGSVAFAVGAVPGYRVYPATGNITVAGGNTTQPILFLREGGNITVEFEERGLPPGAEWGVRLAGMSETGVGALAFENLSNGSYAFSVDPVAGYRADPSAGTIGTEGTNQTVEIEFGPASTSPAQPELLGVSALGWGGIGAGVGIAAIAVFLLHRRRRGQGGAI
jgi:YVTN family beta-propeller protein